jgi:hypothetical protein
VDLGGTTSQRTLGTGFGTTGTLRHGSVQGLYTEDELERVAAEKHTYPWPLPKSTNSQKLALSSKPAALSIAQSDTMQLVRFSEQAGISLTISPRPTCLTLRTRFAE